MKASYEAHSVSLEAAGVSIMLRWLLRSPHKHHTRVAALIDAQAVLGAVTKGRSSAATLRYEMQRIAALSIAGGWLIRYVYVPSAFEPADEPSRGKTFSGGALPGIRKKMKPKQLSSWVRSYLDRQKALRKVAAYRMGMLN